MNSEQHWQAVLARDVRADDVFVYAVRSTKIYCRPSCPSRRPRREQVEFFAEPDAAERAGYRACRRCRPRESTGGQPEWVARACAYIESHLDEPLTLDVLSRTFHLSASHLQRTFKRATGLTPREYAHARRLAQFKARVKDGERITDALYDAGFSSSSRLYERASSQLGMTPTTYRNGGEGVEIQYDIVDSALGRLMVAATAKGICFVSLGDEDAALERALRAEYPAAHVKRESAPLRGWLEPIVRYVDGEPLTFDLPLDVHATEFQRRVWQRLQAIPYGSTRTYSEIARALGNPKANRAVAQACATNPVSLVIPCHRVVRSDGGLGGYRWGLERKQKLLEQERRR
ncbi:MAG: bifunctional DNA-binding transcriptional regulator/O6-methylguanine-DNA methyltransferase Ada [Chloroflexi bacterium]|nr:bifunctional DNA-binding transcriptional regulator/O6-methylguanine-DNA methyltransferase Ada [Chloroflexota bacterium]